MRILAIGVGGAGSRIVDQLYNHDRKSSVSCVSSVVVDVDSNFLAQLKYLPETSKILFSVIDPDVQYDIRSTVDVSEIMTRVKGLDNIDIDAIMVFTGLGGNVCEIVPEITAEIRKSYFEPVFAVCTLPYLREGRAVAKKAADDIEKIEKCVDGIILFDNETWYRKIKSSFETTVNERGETVVKPSPYGRNMPNNPRDIYMMLNERIAKQIDLLLRAGEFDDRGVESAQTVLDAGEILNTLKGNGLTAIGYASEELPFNLLDAFEKWRSEAYFAEGSHKRATRIVALAKQAVYEEISVPCDLTSADKALILIAGPSKELSMKGFQTVRKWIDSSIAGLEMRSGDYPVGNVRFVGIIIMLSGIHNIPRLEEIRKLRSEIEDEQKKKEKEEENMKRLDEEETMFLSGKGSGKSEPKGNFAAGQQQTPADMAGDPIIDIMAQHQTPNQQYNPQNPQPQYNPQQFNAQAGFGQQPQQPQYPQNNNNQFGQPPQQQYNPQNSPQNTQFGQQPQFGQPQFNQQQFGQQQFNAQAGFGQQPQQQPYPQNNFNNGFGQAPGQQYNPQNSQFGQQPQFGQQQFNRSQFNQQQFNQQQFNQQQFDEQSIENEAWELIGGFSSVPPKRQPHNPNLAPIIEDNGFSDFNEPLSNSQFSQNPSQFGSTNSSPFEQNSSGSLFSSENSVAESLSIDEFLEDDGDFETEKAPSGAVFYTDGIDTDEESTGQLAFEELLDEDDGDDFTSSAGKAKSAVFSDAALSYIIEAKDDAEIYPQTSPEYIKEQEYEEYKEEEKSISPEVKVEAAEEIRTDKITVAGGKKEKTDKMIDLNLPGRSKKTDLDMTRMTTVDLGSTPKDRIFSIDGKETADGKLRSDVCSVGEKFVLGDSGSKRRSDVCSVGETINIDNAGTHSKGSFRPKDTTFTGGGISAGTKSFGPNDSTFTGSGKLIAGKQSFRPNDSTFSGGMISAGKQSFKPNDSAFGGGGVSIQPIIKDKSISGGKLSLHPNIKPKDSITGGKTPMGSSAKKPVELLSGGIKTSTPIRPPKELLSGGVSAGAGGGKAPKELLSGDIKTRGSVPRPIEPLSGGIRVGNNPNPAKSGKGGSGPIKMQKNPIETGSSANRPKPKEKETKNDDDDGFWM